MYLLKRAVLSKTLETIIIKMDPFYYNAMYSILANALGGEKTTEIMNCYAAMYVFCNTIQYEFPVIPDSREGKDAMIARVNALIDENPCFQTNFGKAWSTAIKQIYALTIENKPTELIAEVNGIVDGIALPEEIRTLNKTNFKGIVESNLSTQLFPVERIQVLEAKPAVLVL